MQNDFYQTARNTELSSFLPSSWELFAEPWRGVVTDSVALYQPGRVQISSYSWRARLYDAHCQTTLLPGQPIYAIARTGNVLIVVPEHCWLPDRNQQPLVPARRNKVRNFLTNRMPGWLYPLAS